MNMYDFYGYTQPDCNCRKAANAMPSFGLPNATPISPGMYKLDASQYAAMSGMPGVPGMQTTAAMPSLPGPSAAQPTQHVPIPLPSIPTGQPAGTPYNPFPIPPAQMQEIMPITTETQPPAQTLESIQYTPGFLRTQIGRNVRIDFLIGTNTFQDRSGTLLAVGASYVILREAETDDLLLCDLYSIRFVRFFY